MMETRVLVVGVPLQVYDKIKPELSKYQVDRVLKADEAVYLLQERVYRMVIISYPLYTMPMEEFLQRLTSSVSPSKNAAVMFMVFPGKEKEAKEYLSKGIRNICSMDSAPADIREAVGRLMRIADRIPSKIMIRLIITRDGRSIPLLCQTENLSSTGVFVATDTEIPLGSIVDFQFMLPWDHKPIRGKCEVARNALDESGAVKGLGFKFIEFENDSSDRFAEFLGNKSATTPKS